MKLTVTTMKLLTVSYRRRRRVDTALITSFIVVVSVLLSSVDSATFLSRLFIGDSDRDGLQDEPTFTEEDVPQGAASMAFVFDITGSMYDDLVQVIDGAAKILATTLARRDKPLFNYVLVPFHDPGLISMLL